MLNMVAERFGVHANHGGNRFECMPLHVVTKKVGKTWESIKSDARCHEFIAEFNQCCFDIFFLFGTWCVETEEVL